MLPIFASKEYYWSLAGYGFFEFFPNTTHSNLRDVGIYRPIYTPLEI